MRRVWLCATIGLAWLGCGRGGAGRVGVDAGASSVAPGAATSADAGVRERPLTANERALLLPWFKDGVDYDAVRVVHGAFVPFQPADRYMAPEGKIYAPGALFREDFAAPEVDPYLRAVFVHEVVHVWQHQSGIDVMTSAVKEFLKSNGAYESAYPYTLPAKRELLDYGLEQQSSIIEDVYLVRTHGLAPLSLVERLAPETRDQRYQRVLARFEADPKYVRAIAAGAMVKKHSELAGAEAPAPRRSGKEGPEAPPHLCTWRFETTGAPAHE